MTWPANQAQLRAAMTTVLQTDQVHVPHEIIALMAQFVVTVPRRATCAVKVHHKNGTVDSSLTMGNTVVFGGASLSSYDTLTNEWQETSVLVDFLASVNLDSVFLAHLPNNTSRYCKLSPLSVLCNERFGPSLPFGILCKGTLRRLIDRAKFSSLALVAVRLAQEETGVALVCQATDTELWRVPCGKRRYQLACFSPCAEFVAVIVGEKSIDFFVAATGERVRSFDGFSGTVGVHWTRCGRLWLRSSYSSGWLFGCEC